MSPGIWLHGPRGCSLVLEDYETEGTSVCRRLLVAEEIARAFEDIVGILHSSGWNLRIRVREIRRLLIRVRKIVPRRPFDGPLATVRATTTISVLAGSRLTTSVVTVAGLALLTVPPIDDLSTASSTNLSISSMVDRVTREPSGTVIRPIPFSGNLSHVAILDGRLSAGDGIKTGASGAGDQQGTGNPVDKR